MFFPGLSSLTSSTSWMYRAGASLPTEVLYAQSRFNVPLGQAALSSPIPGAGWLPPPPGGAAADPKQAESVMSGLVDNIKSAITRFTDFTSGLLGKLGLGGGTAEKPAEPTPAPAQPTPAPATPVVAKPVVAEPVVAAPVQPPPPAITSPYGGLFNWWGLGGLGSSLSQGAQQPASNVAGLFSDPAKMQQDLSTFQSKFTSVMMGMVEQFKGLQAEQNHISLNRPIVV